MFGNSVTQYDKFIEGDYGYIIAIDLTLIFAKELTGVQLQDTAGAFQATDLLTTYYELPELINLVNDENCPDFAFSKASDICYIFFNVDVYPYTSSLRFTLYGKRFAKPITSLNDNLDIRESEVELFINYALREASLYSNKRFDPAIERNIKILETNLTS